jgi:hypothetical protein
MTDSSSSAAEPNRTRRQGRFNRSSLLSAATLAAALLASLLPSPRRVHIP